MLFYPLTASLSESLYLIHWSDMNLLEFIIAWVVLAILFLVGLNWADQETPSRGSFLAHLLLLSVPLAFMCIHVVRQLGYTRELIRLQQTTSIPLLSSCFSIVLLCMIIAKRLSKLRRTSVRLIRVSLTVLSPLSILTLYTGFVATFMVGDVKTKYSIDVEDSRVGLGHPVGGEQIHVFLFDELSYEFLYKDGDVEDEFPNIREFSELSDNYHYALSPGNFTHASIPGMFLGKNGLEIKTVENNLYYRTEEGYLPIQDIIGESPLVTLKRKGYLVRVSGWFHQYCTVFESLIDECRASSYYNYAHIDNDRFSLLNPILTTINLLPHYSPYGYLKNPVSSYLHKRNVENAHNYAVSTLSSNEKAFNYFHYPIPHIPFIYDGTSYAPPMNPFKQGSEEYRLQITYIDKLFGEVIHAMKNWNRFDASTIVLMSDHNFRAVFHDGENSRHIPLIMKNPYQGKRRDVTNTILATDVVFGAVE